MAVPLPVLLAKLEAHRDRNAVKVATGARRCGKSRLMRMLRERLAQEELAFRGYALYGGFPEVAALGADRALVDGCLEGAFDTVLALGKVARLLLSSVGFLVSGRKAGGALASSGRKVTQPTVENRLDHLADARLFCKAERYDAVGKERMATLAKHHAAGTGLRNRALGFREGGGDVLENVVYLELLRRGNRVRAGKAGNAEIDFVVEGTGGPSYVQVSEGAADPAALERELVPLRAVPDRRPRTLLTLDWDPVGDHDGVRSANEVDWLLGRG